MDASLIRKYNVPGPRYTSYPTVPFWGDADLKEDPWMETLYRAVQESNAEEGISLYIHLPYCESLCTFCGCNKRITKKHEVETPYIDSVLREWERYTRLVREATGQSLRVREIHLGGGTPTFFSPDNLNRLITGIESMAERCESFEYSIEGHPNNTRIDHLETLYNLGFRRISFGVQDYDERVQLAINRIQPFEKVEEVTSASRKVGFESISHDLVFGLPHQNEEGIRRTIEMTRQLMPDRIAYYSYAHVPWIKGVGQRGYADEDLPKDEEKRRLYVIGKELFEDAGYEEIGMDHFALRSDSLYKAVEGRTLHRNFMGYSASATLAMVGLGVSSISDSWYGFAQNSKTVEEYQDWVDADRIPIFRGHLLNAEDLIIRRHILNMMCQLQTSWEDPALQFPELPDCLERLREMEEDGLLEISENGLKVTEAGRPFVRNICMAFDLHLIRKKPTTRIFSMTV